MIKDNIKDIKITKPERGHLPNKDVIIALYINHNLRRDDISKLFNCSDALVKKWLKLLNIKKPVLNRMKNHYATLEKKYGVSHNSKIKQTREKRIKTSLKHYGTKFPSQSSIIKNKVKETNYKKYGNNNPTLFGSKEFQNRMIKKYGFNTYTKTKMFKDKFKDRQFVKSWLEKQINSKRNNNSFNISKPEEKIFNLLKSKFPNVLYQYKSSIYPYYCDYYIPELKLYIEYNGHWTHEFEPYVGSIEQKNKLKLLKKKAKNNRFYKTAIYVWTNLDVRKKKCFENNKLNYKIFYNMKQFMEWYNEITNNL